MQFNSDQLHEALRVAPAALISVIMHLIVLIVCGLLFLTDSAPKPVVLEVTQDDRRDQDTAQRWESIAFQAEPIEVAPIPPAEQIVDVTDQLWITEVGLIASPSIPHENANNSTVDGDQTSKFPDGLSDEFIRKVRDAQQNGIDIVIVFDSTGSMGPEIETVKNRIGAIGELVLHKIPRAQFSLVTYRDRRDTYLVRGIPLTDDLYKIQGFISDVRAMGGGDHPEAVEAGMDWAMTRLYFRPDSQKVMLIFGDAPPHQHHTKACLKMATHFREVGNGRVSTITCRNFMPLPEFYSIARSGGGDAYTLRNSRGLMEELLILAFGREHRQDVLKFFELEP